MNKKILAVTRNIAKKGFSGMRSSSPASISLYLDSDVLRNPFHAILPPFMWQLKKTLNQFVKMRNLIIGLLIFIPLSIFSQTNFDLTFDNSRQYSKAIKQNKKLFDSLGFKINNHNTIATNTTFFENEYLNYFKDFDLLEKYITLREIDIYKNMFVLNENTSIQTDWGKAKYINPDTLKQFCILLKKVITITCDTSNVIYKIAEDSWISKQIEVDFDNDYRTYVYEGKTNEPWACVLSAYRIDGWHNDLSKRDCIAYLCGDRKEISEWINIRNIKQFTHNGRKYDILSYKSCETKLKILDKIIFLCDLSNKYKQKILTN